LGNASPYVTIDDVKLRYGRRTGVKPKTNDTGLKSGHSEVTNACSQMFLLII
jgi:hypothetical protein